METEIKAAVETGAAVAPEEKKYVIVPKTPYRFEGEEYPEIDLSGLEKLMVGDVIDAQKIMQDTGETAAMTVCETTTAFAHVLAARAAEKPIEFFQFMPRGLSKRVSAAVREALGEQGGGTENHVLRFAKPHVCDGQERAEVDLSGLYEMTGMDEGAAENRMAREGFVVTETRLNYLYACFMAGRATGLGEKFFITLPLCEALKLKNAVNDPDFFE